MTANVGNLDRLVRLILGIALFLLPFVTQAAVWDNAVMKYGAIVVGLVLAGTSAMKFCPLYRILGVSTCRR
ncbi:DUF2892 domain-containing protein [Shimia thalassica]|uniref:Inner membrane protein YgaP-like transmembrane domain-containing protein n=1 Tax=Shimia thalassica TaxID=1715693 RepID=A0A0P1II29_9RHOB|nr:DUF2892 domain-containing protein [Shimia thalassica]PHO04747.1 DUF2892 domain-containing protein [Rhodobacteraceae bacterium 4F10]MBU2943262.1 DUF2892 domain-containing protein [Shimia thalassica]MDO6478937.1 DUF2892 domain-containing protein [Shimia thalassica]MDO6484341.1 DUF2892 domain-containing protein [Shimia thalassica]MDO6501331.1 DUF2892 domain-containing protein [Shimia thalassica]